VDKFQVKVKHDTTGITEFALLCECRAPFPTRLRHPDIPDFVFSFVHNATTLHTSGLAAPRLRWSDEWTSRNAGELMSHAAASRYLL